MMGISAHHAERRSMEASMNVQGLVLGFYSLVLAAGLFPGLVAGAGNEPATSKAKQREYSIQCTVIERTASGKEKVLAVPKMTFFEGQECQFSCREQITLPDARRVEFGDSARVIVNTVDANQVRVDLSFESKVPSGKDESGVTVFGRSVRTIRNVRLGEVNRVVTPDAEGAAGLSVEMKVVAAADQVIQPPPQEAAK
jgi:hypothetical protein